MNTPAPKTVTPAPKTVTTAPKTATPVRARNATTHGLFARDVVLPHLGEDPAAFDTK